MLIGGNFSRWYGWSEAAADPTLCQAEILASDQTSTLCRAVALLSGCIGPCGSLHVFPRAIFPLSCHAIGAWKGGSACTRLVLSRSFATHGTRVQRLHRTRNDQADRPFSFIQGGQQKVATDDLCPRNLPHAAACCKWIVATLQFAVQFGGLLCL